MIYYRGNRPEGVILLSSLMILALLTAMVLVTLQNSLLYRKALNQSIEKTEQLDRLEKKAYLLFQKIDSGCMRDRLNPNAVIDILRRRQGCSFKEGDDVYYYLMENLGVFPCIQMYSGSEIKSTMHRRLSVFQIGTQRLLQIRVAYPTEQLLCEGHPQRWVKQRISSWRYVRLDTQR